MRVYFDDRPVEVACDILGVSLDAARDLTAKHAQMANSSPKSVSAEIITSLLAAT